MSLNNPATAYRRSTNRPRVPVVLPLVRVDVNPDGLLSATVDGTPFPSDAPAVGAPLSRADLPSLLDRIADECGTALRVEVHEPGGKVFTDFHTASVEHPARANRKTPLAESEWLFPGAPTMTCRAGHASGGGFMAEEEISVAIVVLRVTAAEDGTVKVRLPVALLDGCRTDVVLIGHRSGAAAPEIDDPAPAAREAS